MTVLEPVIQFLQAWQKKTVTLAQVIAGAERPRKPVLRVMDRLVREGCLEETEDNRIPARLGEFGRDRRNPTWKIIARPLVELARPKPKRLTVRDRIWKLIRARRRCTRLEIRRLASASIASAEDYTKLLERDGYIRAIGKDGRRKVYLLIKDPGPARPVIKEKTDD
ncbi:MAG: hypothetical protein P4L42_15585 [Desulfocapsaceae bacterium]|nr:hypothetical protein [Desulfocapsaceae bacterium]